VEIKLRGIGVSPGVAIGPAVPFHVESFDIPRYRIDDIEGELVRFDEAVVHVREKLTRLRDQTADELGNKHSAIFNAHLDILDDVTLRPELERRLAKDPINVEYHLDDYMGDFSKRLKQVSDPIFRERSIDVMDINRRILGHLLGRELESLAHLDHPCVIVAHDLTPSESVNMDLTNTLGLTTDAGGPTSHVAILARAFEIPSVVGLRYMGTHVAPGDAIIVDGTHGLVVVRPDQSTLAEYEKEKESQERSRRALLNAEHAGPSVTLDGVEIPTFTNIELLAETRHSLDANCQGVGLYRTEYLFMDRAAFPTEEEQYQSYKQVIESMNPLPVTIRTLDIGGDKLITGLSDETEVNPQLGWRSIRLCLDRPDVFKAQLRALFRASVHGSMKIMFPMISGLDQLRDTMVIVQEVKADLDARGVPYDANVQVGTMIEVPSAVQVAASLAKECDFFSIGTNDLIQYCLAVDRVNQRTAHLYEPTHPGVLQLLKQTIDAAHKAKIPCSICGEMAGDPMITELLLGLGFRSLSMSAVSLPMIRAEIANTRITTAKRFARKILSMGSVTEIKEALRRRYADRGTMKLYADEAASPVHSTDRPAKTR
jgi:phosphotransferase system enzyme I (PtsI)